MCIRDSEDGDWMAHFIELPNISAWGETPEQAIVELRITWTLVKDSYREAGEPVPIPARQLQAVQMLQ